MLAWHSNQILKTFLPEQQLSHVLIIQSSVNLELSEIANMGLFVFAECGAHHNGWFFQF